MSKNANTNTLLIHALIPLKERALEYAAQQFLQKYVNKTQISQIISTCKGVRENGIHTHMSMPAFEYILNMFLLI